MKILRTKTFKSLIDTIAVQNTIIEEQRQEIVRLNNILRTANRSSITQDVIFPNTDERGLTGETEIPDETNISDILFN